VRSRSLTLVATSALVATASGIACNSIFGNEAGYLVDMDAMPAGDAAGAESDASAQLEAGALADDAHDGNPVADARPDRDGPWTPASFGADLALWLDGDRGVTSAPCEGGVCVSHWADQSGKGNDATPTIPEIPPALSPVTYRGHSAIRFDGNQTSLDIADNASLQFQSGVTIVGVAAMAPAATQQGGIYGKTEVLYPYRGAALWVNYANNSIPNGRAAAQVEYNQAIGVGSGYYDGTLRAYAMIFDGTNLEVRVNQDLPAALQAAGEIVALGADAYIGGRPNQSQVFLGDIAEVIVVGKGLKSNEYLQAYGYLKAKYGL
jgi:hypothetical protein